MCKLLKIVCVQYLQSFNSHSLLNSTVAPTPALKLSSDVTHDLLVAKPQWLFSILVYFDLPEVLGIIDKPLPLHSPSRAPELPLPGSPSSWAVSPLPFHLASSLSTSEI